MPRTPRKTEKPVDHHGSMANRNASGETGHEDDGITGRATVKINSISQQDTDGIGHPLGQANEDNAVVKAPMVEVPQRRVSARISNRNSELSAAATREATRKVELSAAATREATRKVQAKGKDTLMRQVFHNPDGSLRGTGADITPLARLAPAPAQISPAPVSRAQVSLAQASPVQASPAQVSPAHVSPAQVSLAQVSPAQIPSQERLTMDTQTDLQAKQMNLEKSREKSKKDDWRYKAKGGVTFENSVEVFEKSPQLIGCGAYDGVEVTRESMVRGGGEAEASVMGAEAAKQKLPTVFHFEPPRSKPSVSSGNFMHTDSNSPARNRIARENAVEIFEKTPSEPSYGIYPTNDLIDPELLRMDDERFGRRPPVEDKIWFIASPFRTTPMFDPNELTSANTSHPQGTVFFSTSNKRGSVEVESAGSTLDVIMAMEKTHGSTTKRKRQLSYEKPKKDPKLMSGEKGADLSDETGNGIRPRDHMSTYRSPYDDQTTGGNGIRPRNHMSTYRSPYDDQTTGGDDPGLTELEDEERSRSPSPRFL